MLHKMRIALVVNLLALAAGAAVNTASAGWFFFRAVPLYYVPL